MKIRVGKRAVTIFEDPVTTAWVAGHAIQSASQQLRPLSKKQRKRWLKRERMDSILN